MTFFWSFIITTIISISRAVQLPLSHRQHDQLSSIRGPLITENFPDPSVLYHEGITYAFATNNRLPEPDTVHVQVATSSDNLTWTLEDELDALPHLAPWQTGRAVWAPDVKHLPDGRFLLYYTDSIKTSPRFHCIGAAISEQVTGPFVPLEAPLICPHGGAIDPAGFVDRSTSRRYIVYKVDGNSLGYGGSCNNDIPPRMSTPIMLQEVDAQDGFTLIGTSHQLLDRGKANGPLIEAPALYQSREGIYFLFFSSNCFTTPLYDTSYATSTNLLGPYSKAAEPLLATGSVEGLVGPGGLDIIHHSYVNSMGTHHELDARLVLFHGHIAPANGLTSQDRVLRSTRQRAARQPPRMFTRGLYSAVARFRGHVVSLDLDPEQIH